MTPRRPNSLRLQEFNYAEAGAYFVTIVTYGREAILGDVIDKQVELNRYGSIVANIWKDLPNRYNHVVLDELIIMPDHMHGIIWIHTVGAGSLLTSIAKSDDSALHDTNKPARTNPQPTLHGGVPRAGFKSQAIKGPNSQSVNEPAPTKSLSEIIRNFKTVSAKRINLLRKLPSTPVWQRGFHDRIIRDEEELNATRLYIQTNSSRWANKAS